MRSRRILVLRALGLGDLLTAVPALRALRDEYAGHALELACPSWLHDLVRALGIVDATVDADPLGPLPASAARPGLGVNLHGRGPQSTRLLLSASPERMIAFRHGSLPETWPLPEWRPYEHDVARWCRLLSECGVQADRTRLRLDVPDVAGAPAAKGCVVVHPGAASPARRWPWRRWAEIARGERAAGRRVVVTGVEAERPVAMRVAASAGVHSDDVLAGRTSALELAAVVGRAGLVLAGDTGVAHVATAFGVPSVTLFGPVPPAEWGPPPSRAHRALWTGRRGDPHGDSPDPALLELTVDRVAAEIDDLRADLDLR